MNELIRELAYQAANGMLSYDGEGEWRLSEKEAVKFAELIVEECIRYFNEDYQRDPYTLWREDLTKGIKKHFEVKE